jgi:hypothetical protein
VYIHVYICMAAGCNSDTMNSIKVCICASFILIMMYTIVVLKNNNVNNFLE